jgi:hypothetical protein
MPRGTGSTKARADRSKRRAKDDRGSTSDQRDVAPVAPPHGADVPAPNGASSNPSVESIRRDPVYWVGRRDALLLELRARFERCRGWTPKPSALAGRSALLRATRAIESVKVYYASHLDEFERMQYAYLDNSGVGKWVAHLPLESVVKVPAAELQKVRRDGVPMPERLQHSLRQRYFGRDFFRRRGELADDLSDDAEPLVSADDRLAIPRALGCSLLCDACVQSALAAIDAIQHALFTTQTAAWEELSTDQKKIVNYFLRLDREGDRAPKVGSEIARACGRDYDGNKQFKKDLKRLVSAMNILVHHGKRGGYALLNRPRHAPNGEAPATPKVSSTRMPP